MHFHLEKPDGRPALIFDQVEDLELRASSAAPPSGDEPVVALHNVRRGFVQGCRAQPGTKTLFQLAGAQTERITAIGNELTEAITAVQFEPGLDKNVLRQDANLLRSA